MIHNLVKDSDDLLCLEWSEETASGDGHDLITSRSQNIIDHKTREAMTSQWFQYLNMSGLTMVLLWGRALNPNFNISRMLKLGRGVRRQQRRRVYQKKWSFTRYCRDFRSGLWWGLNLYVSSVKPSSPVMTRTWSHGTCNNPVIVTPVDQHDSGVVSCHFVKERSSNTYQSEFIVDMSDLKIVASTCMSSN